ncbi:Mak10 subunit, NatC N-terminal acetyltransferase-domain-containing protein [Mrakia frigida]|uniref:N-alpha-acetyltransferase 35, NatC auxiliary subunit n=1 Tax=Mrakia frigida TaxID=29902 RepID=UPI003FCBFC78
MSFGAKNKTFKDATDLILKGTENLASGELIHLPHFTLMDAMNAIEVMDPRMDSGVQLPDTNQDLFDPSSPLLPEEVCWILDRALACEMAYLTGLTLSQTAFTILHLLPENLPLSELANLEAHHSNSPKDPARPLELVGLVLRAGLRGTSKCLGVIWEELMKGNLYEGEDFSGDKFDLGLCDTIPDSEIVSDLEEAHRWLESSGVDAKWKEALSLRIFFRISLLQTLTTLILPTPPASSECSILQSTLFLVDKLLPSLTTDSIPVPADNSPALKAFDPNINRKLVSQIPLQAVEIGPIEEAAKLLKELVKGLEEVVEVGRCAKLGEVMEFVSLRSAAIEAPPPLAVIRSLTLSTIYSPSSNLILHVYPLPWLVQTYLEETALVPAGLLHSVVDLAQDDFPRPWGRQNEGGTGKEGPTLGEAVGVFEQRVSGFLVSSMSNSCQNRSRGKRMAAKSISQWEELHDEAMDLIPLAIERLELAGFPESLTSNLHRIPSSLHLHRLTLLRDLLFSGFDLTLYSRPEHAMIYWAGAKLFRTEERVVGDLIYHAAGDLESARVKRAGGMETETERVVRKWETRREGAKGLADLCMGRLVSSLAEPAMEAAKEEALFDIRFKFLKKTASSSHEGSDDRFVPTYREFKNEVSALRGIGAEYLNLRAANFLAQARPSLEANVDEARRALEEDDGSARLMLKLDLEWKERFLGVCDGDEKGHPWFPL